jgi:hypothetical protein
VAQAVPWLGEQGNDDDDDRVWMWRHARRPTRACDGICVPEQTHGDCPVAPLDGARLSFRLGMDRSMEKESGIALLALIAVGPHSEIVAAATRAIEQYAASDWVQPSQEPFDGVGYDGQ